MKCPLCNGYMIPIEGELEKESNAVRRTRGCVICKTKFTSIEKLINSEVLRKIGKKNERFKR